MRVVRRKSSASSVACSGPGAVWSATPQAAAPVPQRGATGPCSRWRSTPTCGRSRTSRRKNWAFAGDGAVRPRRRQAGVEPLDIVLMADVRNHSAVGHRTARWPDVVCPRDLSGSPGAISPS